MGKTKSSKKRKLKLQKFKERGKLEKINLSDEERNLGKVLTTIIILMILLSVAFVVYQVS